MREERAERARGTQLLQGLAKPKVLRLSDNRIAMQQSVANRIEAILEKNKRNKVNKNLDRTLSIEEILNRRIPDTQDTLVGLGAVLFPEAMPETVSGIISRAKLIDAPEPRAQGMPWFRPQTLDDDLKRDIIINTVRTMEQAGQIEYLKASGLMGKNSYVVAEVHYYRERPQSQTGFHKDTVGTTMFVNLNYLNDEEIAGPEYILNPRSVPTHEENIEGTLPDRFLTDLGRAKAGLQAPSKIKWAGNIPKYGVVTFVDELIHHATPVTSLLDVSWLEIEAYERSIWKKPDDITKTNEDVDQELKLRKLARDAKPSNKKMNRNDLRTAGVKESNINAIFFNKRGPLVGIKNAGETQIVGPGQPALSRKISQIHINTDLRTVTPSQLQQHLDGMRRRGQPVDPTLWELARGGRTLGRRILFAAGMDQGDIDALLSTSQTQMKSDPDLPRTSSKPRSFFRSWVRAIPGPHPRG